MQKAEGAGNARLLSQHLLSQWQSYTCSAHPVGQTTREKNRLQLWREKLENDPPSTDMGIPPAEDLPSGSEAHKPICHGNVTHIYVRSAQICQRLCVCVCVALLTFVHLFVTCSVPSPPPSTF